MGQNQLKYSMTAERMESAWQKKKIHFVNFSPCKALIRIFHIVMLSFPYLGFYKNIVTVYLIAGKKL